MLASKSHLQSELPDVLITVACVNSLFFQGLMKGYIARERGMIVLSKGGTAFPGTGV